MRLSRRLVGAAVAAAAVLSLSAPGKRAWRRGWLYLGFFIAFWATPVMSFGHLLLAAGLSVYMLVAIRYEERDLVGLFGRDSEDYRSRVGMITPRLRHRAATRG